MFQELLSTFMAKSVAVSQHDHWIGGPARHKSAYCAVCDRPFLLIWDLNCRDERFVLDGKSVFGTLDRLPLYYCWTCSSRFSYRLTADDIEILEFHGEYQGDDFPYSDYPENFPRVSLEFFAYEDVPAEVNNFFAVWKADENRMTLSVDECDLLTRWFGHTVKNSLGIWWAQLGGEPFLIQGTETYICPNPKCSGSKTGVPMKVLAAIPNDPPSGLPMLENTAQVNKQGGHFNHFVQLVYYFCDQCHTIRALNECD
jgi:hypothetical protein